MSSNRPKEIIECEEIAVNFKYRDQNQVKYKFASEGTIAKVRIMTILFCEVDELSSYNNTGLTVKRIDT